MPFASFVAIAPYATSASAAFASVDSRPGAPPALLPPLAHAPLDTPLVVTGGFGEYRKGHFHAGLDFGTGRRVGRPVYAPLDGWIERVRASGAGYGRSLYLHTEDGRLLVFGHLDAYDGPVAAYVAAVQDSSGQYEQDLWPEPRRFPVRAGARIAWTGESGAGGPHLHFEIRVVDMAYAPLRAGVTLADTRPPSLPSVVLEPLDGFSRVAGSPAPRPIVLGPTPDTVAVIGRVRAIVSARDGVWSGVDRMVPLSVRAEWDDAWIECRFDSISWATDMAEGDYVYDTGRVRGQKDMVLWAPPGFRPRVIRASAPQSQEAGTIVVNRGDPARTLRLTATDASGNRVTRDVVLRADDSPARRDSTMDFSAVRPERIRFASLPDGWVRASAPGRVAILPLAPALRRSDDPARGASPSAPDAALRHLRVAPMRDGEADSLGPLRWAVPAGGLFEPAVFLAETLRAVPGTLELKPLGVGVALHPDDHPTRRPIAYRLRMPRGAASDRVGLYQDRGEGWEFVRSRFDSAGRFLEGETRGLGRFALLRDVAPPRLGKRRAPRKAPPGPYARWALELPVVEDGSGVDARASAFVVDGKPVPSEWDGEGNILRWRPRSTPRSGRHRWQVEVTDRAGNVARAAGTFVLD